MNQTLDSYLREVYCVCPECGCRAVLRTDNGRWSFPVAAKVTCRHCGFARTWHDEFRVDVLEEKGYGSSIPLAMRLAGKRVRVRSPYNPQSGRDPIFGLPLFLTTTVRGHTLVALNRAHIRDLRTYVAAEIRPRPANMKWAMYCRLPAWIKARANRAHVLRALDRLEARI